MPNSPTYCAPEDVFLGDLDVPRYTSVEEWVQRAADEINATIGQVYRLPLDLNTANPANAADLLLLKKINSYLATGRIILSSAAGGEDNQIHAYGKHLIDAALRELALIRNGSSVIEAGVQIDSSKTRGPLISNRDAVSYVDEFFGSNGTAMLPLDQFGSA